ncbi:MAG TPA: c-type cytochrome [Porticoccus sp.]|nr:c-type cytochrome [Porticoccus sp.]
MKKLLSIFGSVVLLVMSSSCSLADLSAESDRKLITEIREHGHYPCAECHGIDGNPPITDQFDKQSPSLASQHSSYLERQLQAFKSGQRKAAEMDGMLQDYTLAEINQMAKYFSSQPLRVNPDLDPTIDTLVHTKTEDMEWVARGKVLYQQGDAIRGIEACSSCHGLSGKGNEEIHSPLLSAQHARYIRMTLQAYRQGARVTDTMMDGSMQKISKKLNDEDIRNVAAYLQSMDPVF